MRVKDETDWVRIGLENIVEIPEALDRDAYEMKVIGDRNTERWDYELKRVEI